MKHRTKFSVGMVVASLIAAMLFALTPRAEADPAFDVSVVGQPLAAPIRSLVQAQGVGLNGRPQAYWITDGDGDTPAAFQVTDVRTGERTFTVRVPSGQTSYAMEYSAADQAVYIAMTDGTWYRFLFSSEKLETLPRPDAIDPVMKGAAIWALGIAEDGTVYAGTNSGAHLIRYSPRSGEATHLGEPLSGENAIRSLAVTADSVYVGTESTGRLAVVDRHTAETNEVALPVTGSRGVMRMALAGDLLLMRLRPSNILLAYNTKSGEVVKQFPNMDGVASGLDPEGAHFYYYDRTLGVMQVDATTLDARALGNRPSAIPESWAFVDMAAENWPGHSISFTFQRGRNYINNYESGAHLTWMDDKLVGTAAIIQGLATDSAGRIVTGGVSGAGLSVFDGFTGRLSRLATPGGGQRVSKFGDALIYADITNGQLRVLHPEAPLGEANPSAPLTLGRFQTNPLSFLPLDEKNVVVASAPAASRSTGALTFWNTETGSTQMYRGIACDRSVTSVAQSGGRLVVGSSVNNGPGAPVTVSTAVLLSVNPENHSVVQEFSPSTPVRTIAAVTKGEGDSVWAIADGHLWHLSMAPDGKMTLNSSVQLGAGGSSMYGEDWTIIDRDDALWATAGGALWRVSLDGLEPEQVIANGVTGAVAGGDGNIYAAVGTQLIRVLGDGGVVSTPPDSIPPFSGERVADQAVSLGSPINEITAIGGTVVTEPDGTRAIFSVTNGSPGRVNKIDATTGRLIWARPLTGSGGSYSVVHDKLGNVYIAGVTSAQGYLHRVKAGSDVVEQLVRPVPGQTFLWDIDISPEGVIFGATFPGAKLWSYDTVSGAVRDYGTVVEGSQQGRAVAYHQDVAYVGLMTPGKLVAVNVTTGVITDIALPATVNTNDPLLSVFDVDAVDGRLFVRVGTDIRSAPLHVYDLSSREWLDHAIPDVGGLSLPPSDPNPESRGQLYVMQGGELRSLDPLTGQSKGVGLRYSSVAANYRGVGWLQLDDPQWPGHTLAGMFGSGQMWRYNPVTGRSWLQPRSEVEVQGAYATVLGLEPAARGGIWIGGYLSGYAHADLDAGTGDAKAVRTFGGSQTESLFDDGERLWLGIYPDSRVAWTTNDIVNPAQRLAWTMQDAEGVAQDRSPGVAANERWVVSATGPKLTSFGGSLGILDRDTCQGVEPNRPPDISSKNCTFSKVDGLSPDRGFTSTTLSGDIAYATSWILGGTGSSNPPQQEGQIIAYDLKAERLLWSVSPVRGSKSYVGATLAPDGSLWALGETSVVQLDPATGRTLKGITLPGSVAITNQTFPALVGVVQLVPGTDRLLVKVANNLYEVSTSTGSVKNHGPFPYRAMTVNAAGLVFMSSGSEILKWQLPEMSVSRALISQPSAKPGAIIHLNVDGFEPSAQAKAQLVDSGGVVVAELGQLSMDRSGSTARRLVLSEAPGGDYRIEVSSSSRTASASIRVEASDSSPQPTPEPSASVSQTAEPSLTASPTGEPSQSVHPSQSTTPQPSSTVSQTATATPTTGPTNSGEPSHTTTPSQTTEPSQPAPGISITLSRQTVRIGDPLTITGRGFQPGGTVRVEVRSDPILLGTVRADASGQFRLIVTVPTIAPGQHTVIATAASGTASADLTVSASPGLPNTGVASNLAAALAAASLIAGALLIVRRRQATG